MPETDYPPELRATNVLAIDPSVLRIYNLGYWDGRASREDEIEALRTQLDDYYRLAFDRSLHGSTAELAKLRARTLELAAIYGEAA
jgi:hypothetical protein